MTPPRNGDDGPVSIWPVLLGPALFLLLRLLPRPDGLTPEGAATLAVAVWMATWWLTIAVPLAVTALLPLALFPILGIATPGAAAAPYANPVIFLFMGGFFIAAAMQRWELHRRIALAVIAWTGTSPRRLLAGFMLASAFLSMWMSNTAATLLMMPIGVAVLRLIDALEPVEPEPDRAASWRLGTALMLGIAYAGSIGGVATLIGTPPNAVLAGVADEMMGLEVSFTGWLRLGLPISVVMLILCWAALSFPLYRLSGDPMPGAAEVIGSKRGELGSWGTGERVTAAVFGLAALAWIFRSPKELGAFTLPGINTILPDVGDATIAMTAALVLFLWPTSEPDGERTWVLDWKHASTIPWDILILFGGGLSLASAFESTGLTGWVGGRLVAFSSLPNLVVISAVATLFVFLTEITSNTATATLGLPVMAGLAPVVGVEALPLMTVAALSASMAFMLPVATPPNAIVFGSGRIEAREMRRAGLWLNLAAILVVTLGVYLAS